MHYTDYELKTLISLGNASFICSPSRLLRSKTPNSKIQTSGQARETSRARLPILRALSSFLRAPMECQDGRSSPGGGIPLIRIVQPPQSDYNIPCESAPTSAGIGNNPLPNRGRAHAAWGRIGKQHRLADADANGRVVPNDQTECQSPHSEHFQGR